ncbi:MAG: sigma 54-interacting transcriptional regulator, partial [Planctomycetota bacterium]|nr:sigma 54-interacting transcriptional regulator [Planctomycetota bacterium]
LGVVEYGCYERGGEDKPRSADVRLIAATNRDLEQSIEMGEFREDLYYRLNIFPIHIPPLRERPSDIRPLVAHMLPLLCKKLKRDVPELRDEDLAALEQHPWPGNVRQLQATMERSLIISRGPVLEIQHPAKPKPADLPEGILTQEQMREREKRNLRAALDETAGRLYGDGGAAELLGMKPTTLASRLKALGIERPGKD